MKFTALILTLLIGISMPIAAHADGSMQERVMAPEPDNVSPGSPPEGGSPGNSGPDAEPEPVDTSCMFTDLIGQKADSIDRSRFGDRMLRQLKPGQMVTMEYMEGRINLQVDDTGVIVAVTCG